IHAGGQSRRLPAYAPTGKILTPLPVFRWERGQKIDQTLLDLQLPLFEKILSQTPGTINTLIGAGDVYIHFNEAIDPIPEADVVCCALWADPSLASNHGVFVCDGTRPERLLYMLQKPTQEKLQELARDHLYLMDIGLWLLSDRAVGVLMERAGYRSDGRGSLDAPEPPEFYDLYSQFGLSLGERPTSLDEALGQLTAAVLPLAGGEFYHYGTNRELIASSLLIQNKVLDQRSILHKDVKPHSSMFVQNSDTKNELSSEQRNLWIENSCIGSRWCLSDNHIITGIPENEWDISLSSGLCLDIVPIGDRSYCIRPYGIGDGFKGEAGSSGTWWMGEPLREWFAGREISISEVAPSQSSDIQSLPLFPVVQEDDLSADLIKWMVTRDTDPRSKRIWLESRRLSADQISDQANLHRLYRQRESYRKSNLVDLLKNYRKSVFFQVNLDHVARKFAEDRLPVASALPKTESALIRMQEQMFLARVKQYGKEAFDVEETNAFRILRESIIDSVRSKRLAPKLNVYRDQIVWGRSPVRIDLAGGWSDTPPSCILAGGAVTNFALEINGQPPLQVYIKPCDEYRIILRSIDIGAREDVSTYAELSEYDRVGSPFSIPKAALILTGFHPDYSDLKYTSLENHLKAFGSGLEISTLAAIPKGSGLGTSSILASTVLGGLVDFCGLGWDTAEICQRTLVLEQLLTTGGGWQDQYGGILHGIKLLETPKGFNQSPSVRWAPDHLYTHPENKACMLLYFTGITRTAKQILSEIVRGMFLNSTEHLSIIKEMKRHAVHTFETLQRGNFNELCACVNRTWDLKQLLDQGTNPPEIQALIGQFRDLASAYKLPGAGGGGYMYIITKDPEAAVRIKRILNSNPPNDRARFVDMNLSQTGFQVTRS
ncbi:MAG: bifunctional fucokinase/L-fucose-1-P-guanylyltransferase, partial [Proteobacteria bacterium]|nr:bifunctional fucokinase/L-fucose-1-P-guanylyltransferase [Pseudomonadota bacterium]